MTPSVAVPKAALPAHAKAGRAVFGALSPDALSTSRLAITLPDGTVVFATQTHIARDDSRQVFTWTGRLTGASAGSVVLTRRRGTLAGIVHVGERVFEVRPVTSGQYVLYELDAETLPDGDKIVTNAATGGARRKLTADSLGTLSAEFEPMIQDLLVVYTGNSLSRHGQAALESMVTSAVAAANEAYRDSRAYVTLNLVGLQRVAATERPSMSETLESLRLDAEVASIRDRVHADLVVLVAENDDLAGIAYLMTANDPLYAGTAFAVVYSGSLATNVLAHEVGHLQGIAHDRETSAGASGAFPYSFGYRRCVADGTGFRDIMSYPCTNGVSLARAPRFSNPALLLNGFPTGVSYELDPANAADGARSLNETAATIAAFRATTEVRPASPSDLTATAVDGLVRLTWVDRATNEAGFKLERSTDGVNFTEIASLGRDATSYSDGSSGSGLTYSYRVRAFNGAGLSAASNTALVTTPSAPPLAPIGLVGQVVERTVVLSWTDRSTDETGFSIERSDDGAVFGEVGTVVADATRFVDATVEGGHAYTYRVRAYNGGSRSGFASEVRVALPPVPPLEPSGLLVSSSESRRISLAWSDRSVNEEVFRIERGSPGVEGIHFHQVGMVGAGVTSFTDSTVRPATTYWYRVIAWNGGGESVPSNVVEVTTRNELPARPDALTAVTLPTREIWLTWIDQSDTESAYAVERAVNGGAFAEIIRLVADSASHIDRDVAPGIQYTYRVRAVNGLGASAYSNTVDISATDPAPVGPSDLSAVLADAAVRLQWKDNSSVEKGYMIERWITGESAPASIASVGPDVTTFVDSTIQPARSFAYRVRAFGSGGQSPYSNEVVVQVPASIPAAPVALSATASSPSEVRLSWTAETDGETSFRVERSADGTNFAQVSVDYVAGARWAAVDRDVSPESNYYYRVRAVNSAGPSLSSAVVRVTTQGAPPSAPAGLVIGLFTSSQVDLSWTDASSNETGFSVERVVGGGAPIVVGTVEANQTSFQDRTVAPATRYTYLVRAFNDSGSSGYSNVATITTLVGPPAVPGGVTASNNRRKQALVGWSPNTPGTVVRYEVMREKYSSKNWRYPIVVASVAAGLDPAVLDTSGKGTFRYSVRACNDGGCSAYSVAAIVKVTK